MLILGALAVLTGLLAILGSPYTIDGGSIYRGDGNDHELQRWQLMALLIVFSGLVASNFTQHRRVRRVTSLLALGLAMVASVAWWWAATDGLLTRTYVSAITSHLVAE